MIFLIAGTTHTGKTALAQKLLEKYHWPYLSIDHLKMGLMRSGNTALTPEDDPELTEYLWPIVREMIKTAIENDQNLVVEGCYIPFDWKKDFGPDYLPHIRYTCLIMTENYIRSHADVIRRYGSVIENRGDESDFDPAEFLEEHRENLRLCKKHGLDYILIDETYNVDIIL